MIWGKLRAWPVVDAGDIQQVHLGESGTVKLTPHLGKSRNVSQNGSGFCGEWDVFSAPALVNHHRPGSGTQHPCVAFRSGGQKSHWAEADSIVTEMGPSLSTCAFQGGPHSSVHSLVHRHSQITWFRSCFPDFPNYISESNTLSQSSKNYYSAGPMRIQYNLHTP